MKKIYTTSLVVGIIFVGFIWIDYTISFLLISIAISAIIIAGMCIKEVREDGLIQLALFFLFLMAWFFAVPFYQEHIKTYDLNSLREGQVYVVREIRNSSHIRIVAISGGDELTLEIPQGLTLTKGDKIFKESGLAHKITKHGEKN
jgi:hypothetical protein